MTFSPKCRIKKLGMIIYTQFWEVFAYFLIGKGQIFIRPRKIPVLIISRLPFVSTTLVLLPNNPKVNSVLNCGQVL